MKKQFLILAAFVCVIVWFKNSFAYDRVYYDDGQTHVISSSSYQSTIFSLDNSVANNPGTHFELTNGGKAAIILPYNLSTVTINGGELNGFNVAIDTHGDNIVTINAGILTGDISSNNSSRIYVNGGTINDDLYAYNTGIVEVHGGSIAGVLGVFDSGKMYLYGTNFKVNGQSVGIGQGLRNFGTLSSWGYYEGNVTGTLQNGSSLNTSFSIWQYSDGDVFVVPEPATLLLLGLGGLMLKRKH